MTTPNASPCPGIHAGFVGFGEVNTPRPLIEDRCSKVVDTLRQAGLRLTVAAPVADDPGGAQAARAVAELSAQALDVLIVCVAGWIPSWAVFRVIEPFKHVPMVLLGLSGWPDGERFVTTADQAGTTALRMPMTEMGYRFKYVVTRRRGALPLDKILSWCRAAAAAARLKTSLIGMAGYRDMRLYGTMYDGLSLKGRIGVEIEHFDLLELRQLMDAMDGARVDGVADETRARWNFLKQPRPGTLENSVRLYLAIREKIEARGYRAFSYSDVDGIKKLMGFAPAGAMTLLHDHLAIPSVPENDSLGAVTQLMTQAITGQIAAYLEFYEFTDRGALMGVPDYVPAEIVDGPVTVLPNAFGDFGEGLLNVSRLKTGQVTLARLAASGSAYRMHLAVGRAREPEPWEEAGWAAPAPQLPSLEIDFDGPVENFIQKVMSQHYILAYGDHREGFEDLCRILSMDII